MLCSLQQRDTAFVDISEKSGPATLAVFGYSITKVYDLDQSGDGATTTIRYTATLAIGSGHNPRESTSHTVTIEATVDSNTFAILSISVREPVRLPLMSQADKGRQAAIDKIQESFRLRFINSK